MIYYTRLYHVRSWYATMYCCILLLQEELGELAGVGARLPDQLRGVRPALRHEV